MAAGGGWWQQAGHADAAVQLLGQGPEGVLPLGLSWPAPGGGR